MPGPGDNDFICEARAFGATMHCGRCELAFAPDVKVLPCKPAQDCGLTASVIRAALDEAAAELGASIDAASRLSIKMGTGNGAPDAGRLRREAALRAGVRLVDRYQPEKGK